MRYFKNPFPDYNHQPVQIPENSVRNLIANYVQKIISHRPENSGDLYVGNAGISYMFLKIHQCRRLEGLLDRPSLEYAQHFIGISKKFVKNDPLDVASFICGNAGIFAVSAVINQELNNSSAFLEDMKDFLRGFSICHHINFNGNGSDEILFGRAGYLSGIFWLNQHLPPHQKVDINIVKKLCDVTIESGINFAFAKRSQVPLLYHCWGDLYLGAAHGLSSILHMLLEAQTRPTDQTASNKLNLVKSSTDYLLGLQNSEGNFPCTLDDIGSSREDKLIHWCHGAPGIFYLMAKSFLFFQEEKYLQSCLKMGDLIWQKGLLLKGPGICHGVAGNGYVFLLLYRLTNDQKHLYRAVKFMEFLSDPKFIREARTPDRPYSLCEGLAGTVCFLVDLLQPERAQFPFMDVFECKI